VFRYILSGLLNTAIGFAVILSCMSILSWTPLLSNVTGYAVGIVVGFFLHKHFTFRSDVSVTRGGFLYLPVVVVAYLSNVVTLLLCLNVLGLNAYVAQVLSIGTYLAIGYIGNATFVFRGNGRDRIEANGKK
jgi:putative flippase GtrA